MFLQNSCKLNYFKIMRFAVKYENVIFTKMVNNGKGPFIFNVKGGVTVLRFSPGKKGPPPPKREPLSI